MDAEVVLTKRLADRVELLYDRYAPAAGRLAYLLTGDRHVAEDISQDAFVRSIARLKNLRDPASFEGYLRRTVINLTRKHWRTRATERNYVSTHLSDATRRDEQPDVATRDEMWDALSALPYEQRAALVLRYYEDLSERDAAAALGCPQGTLKSRVSRGLHALRIEMRGDHDG